MNDVSARSIERFGKFGGCCAMIAVGIVGKALLPCILLLCVSLARAQDIRIAVAGSMTGSLAEAGDEVKRGAELAAAKWTICSPEPLATSKNYARNRGCAVSQAHIGGYRSSSSQAPRNSKL
jgi:hypothetical protein